MADFRPYSVSASVQAGPTLPHTSPHLAFAACLCGILSFAWLLGPAPGLCPLYSRLVPQPGEASEWWALHSQELASFPGSQAKPLGAANKEHCLPKACPRAAWPGSESSRFGARVSPDLTVHGLCDLGHITQPLQSLCLLIPKQEA